MAYNGVYPMIYPQYQPYPVQQSQGINWVQGRTAAQSFTVPAGQSAILMDSDAPYVYKKETAMDGRPLPMEVYKLVKEEETKKQDDAKNYVRVDQIDDLILDKIEDIVKDEVERRLSELSFKPTRKVKNSEE